MKPPKTDKLRLSKIAKNAKRRVDIEIHDDKRFPGYFAFDIEDDVDDKKIDRLVTKVKHHHKEYVKKIKDHARKHRVLKVRPDGEEIYLADVRIKMLREDYVRVVATAAVRVGGARPKAVEHLTTGYASIDDVPSNDEFAAMLLAEIEADEQNQMDDELLRAEIEARVRTKHGLGGD